MKEKDLSFKAFLKAAIKAVIKLPLTLKDFIDEVEEPSDKAFLEVSLWSILGLFLGVLSIPLGGATSLLIISVSSYVYGLLRFAYWMWVDANT